MKRWRRERRRLWEGSKRVKGKEEEGIEKGNKKFWEELFACFP
jgi:hypothetical protein